jgi:hypothetical protein
MTFDKIDYNYKFPANFDKDDKDFDVFFKVKTQKCFKPKILNYKNFRVSNNSVIFRYCKIMKESCITRQNYLIYQKGFGFFLKFILPVINFKFRNRKFALITDEWTTNYYHWHIFALQRLIAILDSTKDKNFVLLLPEKYKKYDFVLPSLKRFGIDESNILFIPRKSNIKTKELIFAKTPQHHPQLANILRQKLHSSDVSNSDYGERIYISRNKQKLRYVKNEEDLLKILEKYGFKKLYTEDMSYEQQIATFSKAKYLISPHGAGLTNILFMQKNTNIMEIATTPTTQNPATFYFKLASFLDINYFYHAPPPKKDGFKSIDAHFFIFDIDLEKFEKNLKLMLSNDK